jgi:hypothetical protein
MGLGQCVTSRLGWVRGGGEGGKLSPGLSDTRASVRHGGGAVLAGQAPLKLNVQLLKAAHGVCCDPGDGHHGMQGGVYCLEGAGISDAGRGGGLGGGYVVLFRCCVSSRLDICGFFLKTSASFQPELQLASTSTSISSPNEADPNT